MTCTVVESSFTKCLSLLRPDGPCHSSSAGQSAPTPVFESKMSTALLSCSSSRNLYQSIYVNRISKYLESKEAASTDEDCDDDDEIDRPSQIRLFPLSLNIFNCVFFFDLFHAKYIINSNSNSCKL